MESIKKIIKRDGRMADFDVDKITEAIYKAAKVLGGKDREMSAYLARQVELYLLEVCHNATPTVEQIQDAVEKIFRMDKSYPGNEKLEGKMFVSFVALIIRNAIQQRLKPLYKKNRKEYTVPMALRQYERLGLTKLSDDKGC